MDRNQLIGFGLIFLLLIGYTYLTAPSEAEIEQAKVEQRVKDSIAAAQNIDTTQQIAENKPTEEIIALPDSVLEQQFSKDFGVFAPSASGEAKDLVLENEVVKITFSTKGARIKDVWLKEYKKWVKLEDNTFEKADLHLLDDKKDEFAYLIPVANTTKGTVSTGDLYFEAAMKGNSVSFKANAGNGRYLEQKYTLRESSGYYIDYDIAFVGLDKVIPDNAKSIQLNWTNYLDKFEKNAQYERNQYSGVHYRKVDKSPKCIGNKRKEVDEAIKWISSAQQFFNTSLLAKDAFSSAVVEAVAMEDEDTDLKKITAEVQIPYNHNSNETFPMSMYIGPNDFNNLRSSGERLEDVIEFGWGIFGSINRWVIRPVFNFLSKYIGSAGIVIFILTLVIKLVLYPLSYKMLHSQAKMGALKPQLEKIKEKTGDDQQAYSAEQMKLYRETGVNPLGGCLPMAFQLPVWFALYRFFPASIDFRQTGFLWADDLASYDSILTFGDLPLLSMVQFDHISLFTILWAVTTLVYTYYNTKDMTMPNPAMKYVQYFMPIMFIFFFNSFASGLTCYLLFSNIMNITQTLVTKNILIDKKKIMEQLEANKKKPKKQSGFQARLEEAMKQQQEVKKQQEAERSKKTQEKRQNRKKK